MYLHYSWCPNRSLNPRLTGVIGKGVGPQGDDCPEEVSSRRGKGGKSSSVKSIPSSCFFGYFKRYHLVATPRAAITSPTSPSRSDLTSCAISVQEGLRAKQDARVTQGVMCFRITLRVGYRASPVPLTVAKRMREHKSRRTVLITLYTVRRIHGHGLSVERSGGTGLLPSSTFGPEDPKRPAGWSRLISLTRSIDRIVQKRGRGPHDRADTHVGTAGALDPGKEQVKQSTEVRGPPEPNNRHVVTEEPQLFWCQNADNTRTIQLGQETSVVRRS
ncbi:hypothetical protein MHYP_G00329370 [Metynnis hypsauchen]